MKSYRPFLRPRSITFQILILYALLILPLAVALVFFNTNITERAQADVRANDLALANAVAQETNITLANALQTVENLSRYQSVREADIDEMRNLFQIVASVRPGVNLIYRLDANGIMLYHFPPGLKTTIGNDFSFRPYFQRARLSNTALMSKGRISPTTNEPVATAVMPIWDSDGYFNGLIATNIRLTGFSETLNGILSEYPTSSGFEIMIIDDNAQIVAHPNTQLLLKSAAEVLPPVYQGVPFGKSGSLIAEDLQGEERLYTFAPIPRTGWGVIISRPTRVAFTTAYTIQNLSRIAIATLLVIAIAFWLFLNQRIIHPLMRLARVSDLIGTEEHLPQEEIQALQKFAQHHDQIGKLIQSLLRAETALADRVKEQTMLLETSRTVVSSLDLTTVLNGILEQVQRLLNVEMCALIALDEKSGNFRVQASRGLSQDFTAHLTIHPNEPDSPTMRAIKSQSPIQISDTEKDPSFRLRRPRARAEGFRALLSIPLKTQHTPPSALLVYHRQPHTFSQREIRLLSSFANQAAMALENAALYARSDARLQEQTRRLEALVSSLNDGLILGDWRGEVVYANRRALQLADLNEDDLGHISVDTVLSRIISKAAEPGKVRQDVSEALKRYTKRTAEIPIEHNGEQIYLYLQVFDVTDTRGIPIGQGQLLRDITTERALDRLKSNLISTVSHELRTPLAAIKGYATTLLAQDVIWDTKSQHEFLRIISHEADRLSQLVSSLLDLSRLEAGRLKLQKQEVDVAHIIRSAFDNVHSEPETVLEMDVAPNLPPVYADPLRLETILRNLVENAVKYAGVTAHIRVKVSAIQKMILFRVEDNGPGIPPEEMPYVFQSYYRIQRGHTQSTRGTGLGLAICEGLVHAHGGEIWVEPLENGTCFAFSIPIHKEKTP